MMPCTVQSTRQVCFLLGREVTFQPRHMKPQIRGYRRRMVDHRFQKQGYAKRALDLVCDHARRVGATRLITSFVPGEHGPDRFYLNYGFTRTGLVRANGAEPELQLAL